MMFKPRAEDSERGYESQPAVSDETQIDCEEASDHSADDQAIGFARIAPNGRVYEALVVEREDAFWIFGNWSIREGRSLVLGGH